MKAFDFEAVFFDGDCYCVECCPVDVESEEVQPIFADAELNSPPECCECGTEHTYMTIAGDDGYEAACETQEAARIEERFYS